MSKKNKLLAVIFAVILLVFSSVWLITKPETASGEKNLTIQVIHSDRSCHSFSVTTSSEYLAEALVEYKIVENNQSTYGLYILTADNETVNESNQEWWCITRNGSPLMTGASETPIADGETYELTFTTGYDS